MESGRYEIYIRSFPDLDQKRQVSNGGGIQPLWRKNGKELFYLTPNDKLMVVDVKPGVPLNTGSPRLLFQTPIEDNPVLSQYAVTADGQKFLLMETAELEQELNSFISSSIGFWICNPKMPQQYDFLGYGLFLKRRFP